MIGTNNHVEAYEIAGKKVTFFPATAIGYVAYPEALLVRGLASGIAAAGAEVRIVEERRNAAIEQTLKVHGSDAMRRTYESFPDLTIHSYTARAGAPLLEWVSREMALIDMAVAIDGLPDELCQWIANLSHPTLTRIFISYRPEQITAERAAELELDKFDIIASPETIEGVDTTSRIALALAGADAELIDQLPEAWRSKLVDSATAATGLIDLVKAHQIRG